MSKNQKNRYAAYPMSAFIKDGIEYHPGWVFTQQTLDIILGNQLAIIEAVGLPEKQEHAIKSQIRQALFRPQRLAIFLDAEDVSSHSNEKAKIPKGEYPIDHTEISNVK